ncbi:OLC1v1036527C1 [Oldenlandia corymbosa var. corymbosa]|uniref:OLC1v1036527C1 n=1 Tax=Oldenlandia corymbosa var. corymbosa TaxID=529605 RepID=A0AAV1CVI6_OLDCO|nr:OLC1v1036527C1 [Oldenlandia corymbosa var. corymbosa]
MAGAQGSPVRQELSKSFSSIFKKPNDVSIRKDSLIKEISFVNGTPTLEFEDDEFEKLIAPHRLCLVGKFSYGRPKMKEMHDEFKKIGFNGGYTLGLMKPWYVLVRFEQEDDYQCCWIRMFWNIGGFSMRILKWTPSFHFKEDPPVVPVWVSLYDLPIEYMHLEVIYSMATALGQPLKVDTLTLNMTRPFVARFCIEINLTKDLPKSVRVGKKGCKHEQLLTFVHIPSYCVKCSKIGHKDPECRIGKPLQRRKDVEPIVVKKKGIKLAPSKPKWSFQGGSGKLGLDVEILNLNLLICKGIEPEVMESSVPSSRPAETLDACALEAKVAETLGSELVPQSMINPNPPQTGNMFSVRQGLDEGDNELPLEKDKSASSAVSSNILPATVTTNRFAALEIIEEVVNEVVSVEREEYVKDMYVENPPTQHEIQNDNEIAGDSHEVLMLENLSPLESGKCLDDGDIGKVSKPMEMEDVDRGVWSDGDADNVHVTGSVQGEGYVHKKHGQKLKEEKEKMQEM